MNDLDPPFSVEEYFARRVDTRWEVLKEQGNVLFKKGKYADSVKLYSQALCISHGSCKSIPALYGVLRKARRGSAARQVSQNPVLFILVSRFLQTPLVDTEYSLCHGEAVTVRLPNQPAAVCYSNRSAAYMKIASTLDSSEESNNYLKKALRDAKLACKHCPGYAKGHFRVFQALKSLGNQAAANTKKHQLALYEHYAANMPWAAIAGVAIQWLSLVEFQLVYSTVRFQEVLRRLDSCRPDTLMSQASLVPFLGGQFLMIGINYSSAEWKKGTLSSLYFVCTDEGGADALDKRPCGVASKTSIQAVKAVLVLFFRAFASHGVLTSTVSTVLCPYCASSAGFRNFPLVLGQGLINQVKTIQKSLQRAGFGDITVYQAAGTQGDI